MSEQNPAARRDVRDYIQKHLSDPVNVAIAEMTLAVLVDVDSPTERAQLVENICSRLRYAPDRNIVREVFSIVSR